MATLSEFSDNLPNMINEVLKQNMLGKLDPELKRRLLEAGGDITFDYKNNTFEVNCSDDNLEKEIIADLKSKR